MSRTNVRVKSQPIFTAEGAKAKHINPEQALRRSIMATMLWEKQFYEDGIEISKRIAELIPKVDAVKVANMAVEAREGMKLRHIPLLIAREMARHNSHKKYVADVLEKVIQRADELAEYVAIYWKDGKQPLSAQSKKGLAQAFTKFSEYALAKYNRDGAVKLRDVLFLCHAKPKDAQQEKLWKKLVANELAIPDTWEVELSAGRDKAEVFARLIKENKLGGLALLRNLRNCYQSGVDEKLVRDALVNMKTDRILPFRFVSAARYAPQWESTIEKAMMKCVAGQEKLPGKTILLVDVSGSMDNPISDKSEMTRMDAACGLAILAREMCEDVKIYSFSYKTIIMPDRHGFALRDALVGSQPHGGTMLGHAVDIVNKEEYDRLIVFTDEQSHTTVPDPIGRGYMVNVASYKNGVGYGKWTHVDGFSEAILNYIREVEQM
jgi:hypothetical protein